LFNSPDCNDSDFSSEGMESRTGLDYYAGAALRIIILPGDFSLRSERQQHLHPMSKSKKIPQR